MRSCSSSSAPNRRLPEVSRVDRRDTSLLQEDHSIGGKSPLIHLGNGGQGASLSGRSGVKACLDWAAEKVAARVIKSAEHILKKHGNGLTVGRDGLIRRKPLYVPLGRTAMIAWPAGDTAAAGAIADRCRCNRGNAVGDLSVGITR